MNSKISVFVFIAFTVSIVLFLLTFQALGSDWVPTAFVIAGPFGALLILIPYIVIKKYKTFELHFYKRPLKSIRAAIRRDKRIYTDVTRFYLLSALINFSSIYFLGFTPIQSIISRMPGAEGLLVPGLEITIFSSKFLDQFNNVLVIFPFMCIGTTILFVMRRAHYVGNNSFNERYPGSRAILVFIYAMIIIFGISMVVNYQMNDFNQEKFEESDFFQIIILTFGLSFFSFSPAILVALADRYLLNS